VKKTEGLIKVQIFNAKIFASTLPKPHWPAPLSKLWQRACKSEPEEF